MFGLVWILSTTPPFMSVNAGPQSTIPANGIEGVCYVTERDTQSDLIEWTSSFIKMDICAQSNVEGFIRLVIYDVERVKCK